MNFPRIIGILADTPCAVVTHQDCRLLKEARLTLVWCACVRPFLLSPLLKGPPLNIGSEKTLEDELCRRRDRLSRILFELRTTCNYLRSTSSYLVRSSRQKVDYPILRLPSYFRPYPEPSPTIDYCSTFFLLFRYFHSELQTTITYCLLSPSIVLQPPPPPTTFKLAPLRLSSDTVAHCPRRQA